MMDQPITRLDEELEEFVDTVLAVLWQDRDASGKWCVRWYEHAEVVNRIYDLHDGWMRIGDGPEDMSLNEWYRYYLDHHMPIITSKESGPLTTCTKTSHDKPLPGNKLWARNPSDTKSEV